MDNTILYTFDSFLTFEVRLFRINPFGMTHDLNAGRILLSPSRFYKPQVKNIWKPQYSASWSWKDKGVALSYSRKMVYKSEGDKYITPVPNRVKNQNNVMIFGRNTTKSALPTLCRKSKRSSCSTMRRQRPARCWGRRRPDMQFRQSGRINVVEDRRSQAKAFTCTTNVIYVHYLRSNT